MIDGKMTATIAEFKLISGLGKNSIYDLLNAGKLRSVMLCGRRLIVLDSYRELLNSLQEVAPGLPQPEANRGYENGLGK